jgi:hypothetical protein
VQRLHYLCILGRRWSWLERDARRALEMQLRRVKIASA